MTSMERRRIARPFRSGLAVAAGAVLAVDERATLAAIVATLVVALVAAVTITLSRRAGPG